MPSFPSRLHPPLNFILALLISSLLAACGGGGEAADPSSIDSSGKVVVRSASVKDVAAPTWTACAQENETCSFSGTATVRYGAGSTFATGSFVDSVACSNSVFGDPAFGVGKSCSYQLTATTPTTPTPPTPPAPPTPPTTWVLCAQENQACSFAGTRPVRYGTSTQNVTGTFTGGVACTNGIFGDPVPGTGKSCWYAADVTAETTPDPSWVSCASEWQTCAFTGTAIVRYGAGTSFASASFSGGVLCANTIFGDPAPGVGKSCSYQVAAAPAPPAPPAPVVTTPPAPTIAVPAITVQPQPVAVKNSQPASFTVTATSSVAMSYQWSRNGVAISGATNPNYAIPVTQLADSGAVFSVAVTNGGGTATSSGAGLTVNAIASTGPTAQRLFSDQSLWNARPTQFTLGSDRIPASLYFPVIGTGVCSVTATISSSTDPAGAVLGLVGQPGIWIPDAEIYAPNVVIPHWPAHVAVTGGCDGHADVIDVANNRIHSFWQLSKGADGQYRAQEYSWTALDGSGWATPGQYFQGVRAAGVVPSAGVIRVNEVNDGQPMYKHALAMSLTNNALAASPSFVFPATAADGDAASTNTGRIAEGVRLMLPASFDTSGITNPALLKVVQTLKVYGAYVVDRNYGTPFEIYVENGSNFDLMPTGWDSKIADQLQQMRAALAPLGTVEQWVDANGAIFTPTTNLNLLSMRGGWYTATGALVSAFDMWQQAVVFPSNGVVTSLTNNGGRSVPTFMAATPAVGTRFSLRVSATGGASLRLTISKAGSSFDSGVMHDGDEVILTWPSGATGATTSVRVSSGPQGGGKVSGTMVQLPN